MIHRKLVSLLVAATVVMLISLDMSVFSEEGVFGLILIGGVVLFSISLLYVLPGLLLIEWMTNKINVMRMPAAFLMHVILVIPVVLLMPALDWFLGSIFVAIVFILDLALRQWEQRSERQSAKSTASFTS
ncbi:hypothetical protein FLK61_27460 [Paenalkalicoccus suaedae]|uniref:Uncharacterized protein n=1 Tax=Paenalkalicoccus suaedae TaxID=2592382 RepID=A0A859FAW9_9BACI|nr:hypothetical protein [Paenalkalicoccus suaedae]QKS70493.1 hypothetical protein FLK61_27460 [Paenalkalicoccus suaedae]